MTIIPVPVEHFETAIAMLKQNNLPVEDITSGTQLFIAEENNEVLGTIGVEYDFNDALLRSLSVAENKRKKGLGLSLVNFLEDYVQKQGIENIYLLTTTAVDFFSKLDYHVTARETLPVFIRQSSEFTSVCPSSATVMKKALIKPGH
jgi:amino-acid N-acetyltransferase